jgi:hypothetical protein
MSQRNSAKVNYTTKQLVLIYEGVTHTFDLSHDDATDYWSGFKDKEGNKKDINFSIDEYDKVGTLNAIATVTDVVDRKGMTDTGQCIEIIEEIGDIIVFAGYDPMYTKMKTLEPTEPTLSFSQSDIEDMQSKISQGGGHVFTWSVEIDGKSVDIEIVTE